MECIFTPQKHGILKEFISKKCTKLQELNNLDNLEIAQIRAIRTGFLIQREVIIQAKNGRLEEYLFQNQFLRCKNALHNQNMQDSYETYKKKRGEKSGKNVRFENSLLSIKPDKGIKVNFAQMVKSTFYSTSLKELCLISQ